MRKRNKKGKKIKKRRKNKWRKEGRTLRNEKED
jgi:hypothetical protein